MILSIGEVLFDCYKEKGETKFLLGGAPFNVASDVRKLGGDSYFVSAIGTKDHLEMEELIKEKTPNVYLFKANCYNTKALVTLENGEREFSFIKDKDIMSNIVLNADLKELIDRSSLVHIGSLVDEEKYLNNLIDIIKYAKRRGKKISFDINYRESISILPSLYPSILPLVDILKVSEDELRFVDDLNNFELVVVTRGEKGAYSLCSSRRIDVEGKKVEVVDTTGAGDAFFSTVLTRLDQNGFNYSSLEEILKEAVEVSASICLKKGALL